MTSFLVAAEQPCMEQMQLNICLSKNNIPYTLTCFSNITRKGHLEVSMCLNNKLYINYKLIIGISSNQCYALGPEAYLEPSRTSRMELFCENS